jgi:hypothetical protein
MVQLGKLAKTPTGRAKLFAEKSRRKMTEADLS